MSKALQRINQQVVEITPSPDTSLINAGQVVGTRANSDDQMIALWLETKRNPGTQQQYANAIRQFLDVIGHPLQSIVLEDMGRWMETIAHLRPVTQNQRVAIIKSLFSFAHKLGYLRVNVGATLRCHGVKETLHERYLTEEQIIRIGLAADKAKDRALIRMLYRSGGRISEVIGVTWADIQLREIGAQVTLFGKGGKTRTVLIPLDLYHDLIQLREGDDDQARIFPITRQRAWAIIKRIAKRAGITERISPHWFRHAHATHALEHSAPIKLVCETLGHSSVAITDRYLHSRPDTSSGDYLKVG